MRLIDADDFKQQMDNVCDAGGCMQPVTEAVREYVKKIIDAQRTIPLDELMFKGETLLEWVDKIERGEIRAERHGSWELKKDRAIVDGKDWECSKCRNAQRNKEKFCPNCGAKMINYKPFDDESWASGIGQTFSP